MEPSSANYTRRPTLVLVGFTESHADQILKIGFDLGFDVRVANKRKRQGRPMTTEFGWIRRIFLE